MDIPGVDKESCLTRNEVDALYDKIDKIDKKNLTEREDDFLNALKQSL